MKTKQSLVGKLFRKIFSGIRQLSKWSGRGIFTVFVWEMVEEGLENLIAFVLSSAIAIFVTKALSTLAIVTATQGIKVGIKRFLYPYIKTLTYKEGNDKMKLLKDYWTKVWGNKITGTMAGIGFGGIVYFSLHPLISKTWLLVLSVMLVFILAYNIAIFFGGETLAQIEKRLADTLLNKEQKAIIKEAKRRLADAQKVANQTQVEKEKEAEKEKATAEFEEKVKKAMADLQEKEQPTKNA